MADEEEEIEDEDALVTCGVCGAIEHYENYDVLGSCPGNLFCNNCSSEVVSGTGEPALLCGACASCMDLKADGVFDITMEGRLSTLADYRRKCQKE